jgi:hypothetical protein
MEDPEARKARLAALRQAKASSIGGASSVSVSSVETSSVQSSSTSSSSTLGEKRKAQSVPDQSVGERVFDGEDEIVEVEDMAESEVEYVSKKFPLDPSFLRPTLILIQIISLQVGQVSQIPQLSPSRC